MTIFRVDQNTLNFHVPTFLPQVLSIKQFIQDCLVGLLSI